MRVLLLLTSFLFFHNSIQSQNNVLVTNPLAEEIMLGNYDPADYMPSTVIDHPDDIIAGIRDLVSTDSLHSYLVKLSSFETRNTGSDTISQTTGMGAARRWAHSKFQDFSADNENRLIPFYLQFDQDVCGMGQHRNTCAILPGLDVSDPSIIIIEAHMDSRCHTSCDVVCPAHGMEDNGSGTSLVIELARVLSQFAFDHSIVFMATTGEEQGLVGADAFSFYCATKNIAVKCVQNNDIVGGITCGETSSPPSCPGLNDVDSTQVRLFAAGGLHRQFSRFIKLEYQEELEPLVEVPMLITVMSQEDRGGRGGDHIPFRERGFISMRFTSANEHGDAGSSDPDYHDRQHTSDDILGVDTDGDEVIDSFFVDFNYLARNTVINGTTASLAAIGPDTPDFTVSKFDDKLFVEIHDPNNYGRYRVFDRSGSNDFDAIYDIENGDSAIIIDNQPGVNFISVASVDENGIESLFTREEWNFGTVGTEEAEQEEEEKWVELQQNRPNPFDEATVINYVVRKNTAVKEAFIVISDLNGKEVKRIPTAFKEGLNEVVYVHGYGSQGTYVYSLVVDGRVLESKRMVFAY